MANNQAPPGASQLLRYMTAEERITFGERFAAIEGDEVALDFLFQELLWVSVMLLLSNKC